MSPPDYKRQKLDVNSAAEMSNESIFDMHAQTFEKVACLDGFVDRTMLIEELLKKKLSRVMMCAPSKFGKTINMDMIRLFCDVEDKCRKTKEDVAKEPTIQELRSNPSENMKVFLRQFKDKRYDECLILKREEFVVQHFGRHPVIYLNFKECTAKNESEAILHCARLVQNSYLENRYLKNSKEFKSGSHLEEKCRDWCNYSHDQLKMLQISDVTKGLKDLVKSLMTHWERDPVLLVDEIDRLCTTALQKKASKDEIHKIQTVLAEVMGPLVRPVPGTLTFQAILVTGICRFGQGGQSSTDSTLRVYFLADSRFSKYYGLTDKEIVSLVEKFFSTEEITEVAKIINDIRRNYNGYYQRHGVKGVPTEYARYCIFSVLSYIKERRRCKNHTDFWSDEDFTKQLKLVLKKFHDIRNALQTLLSDGDSGSIPIQFEKDIEIDDLYKIFFEKKSPETNATLNLLLQRGFLAYKLENPVEGVPEEEEEKKVHVRIPNREIRRIYYGMFEDYYDENLKEIAPTFYSCGKFFESLPTRLNNFTELKADLDQLGKDLGRIFAYFKCEDEASVCAYMLIILKVYARYEKVEVQDAVKYCTENKSNHASVAVWSKHGNFAFILESRYNGNALQTNSSLAAAEDILTFLPGKTRPEDKRSSKAGTGRDLEVLKPSDIKSFFLMGLSVDLKGAPHILAFPNSSEWENVIQVNPESYVKKKIRQHLKLE